MIPRFLEHYFWFNDLNKLDLQKNKDRIILNILNLGDRKATDWLFNFYSKQEIIESFVNYGVNGELSPKSLNYWSLLLGIDSNKLSRSRF